jgi:hypothetical protein
VKWLLDSHVPAAVAAAVLKLQPSWSVEHVSSWQEGVWRNVDDDLLLEYKDAWTDPESQRADEVLGDGTPRLLSDPAPEPPTRFYRVGVVPGS